jgi:hypothetical protein
MQRAPLSGTMLDLPPAAFDLLDFNFFHISHPYLKTLQKEKKKIGFQTEAWDLDLGECLFSHFAFGRCLGFGHSQREVPVKVHKNSQYINTR